MKGNSSIVKITRAAAIGGDYPAALSVITPYPSLPGYAFACLDHRNGHGTEIASSGELCYTGTKYPGSAAQGVLRKNSRRER